jgi:hypothetical protein
MSHIVYLLCATTSLGCTVLLFRSVRKGGADLVMWSALCFLALTIANVLLFIDLVFIPNIDLSLWRTGITFLGGSLLLFGLIRSSA